MESKINQPYFKFVNAIIDSGLWAQLSNAAKTLYPVLLKYSDGNFKPVWPGTEELMHKTGFKTKKSIRDARNELQDRGLIRFIPGNGRKSTLYHFDFNQLYSNDPGYSDISQRDTAIPSGSIPKDSAGSSSGSPGGVTSGYPNNIQITIQNEHKLYQPPQRSKKQNISNGLDSEIEKEFGNLNQHPNQTSQLNNNTPKVNNTSSPAIKGSQVEQPNPWLNAPGTTAVINNRLKSDWDIKWAQLSQLLTKMATSQTIDEFNNLDCCEFEGRIVITGPAISSRLQELINKKLPEAEFLLD